jgi:hypothetical protein
LQARTLTEPDTSAVIVSDGMIQYLHQQLSCSPCASA